MNKAGVTVLAACLMIVVAGAAKAQDSSAQPVAAPGSAAPGSAAPGSAAGSAAATASAAPVTLSQVLSAAMANGPGFQINDQNLAASRAALDIARSAAGVSLNASAGYFHDDYLPGTSKPISAPTKGLSSDALAQSAIQALGASPIGENVQAGLSLTGPSTNVTVGAQHLAEAGDQQDQVTAVNVSAKQTLFDGYPGGRALGTLKQAELNFQNAQLSHENYARSLTLQIKQAYYSLLNDQEAVHVYEANQKQAQEDLSRIQGLMAQSQATPIDVEQARIALRQTQLALEKGAHTATMDRKSLNALAGWPLEKAYSVQQTDPPAAPTLDLSAAIQIAFTHRPELQSESLQLASARVGLQLAKSQYLPTVAATGSLSYQHDWTANYDMGTYTAGISVTVPIVESGRRGAQVRQAQAQMSALDTTRAQEQQQIAIDVENAIFAVTQGKQSLDLATDSVAEAQKQYERQTSLQAGGLASNADVLQYSSALMSAELQLEQARSAYNLAILALENTLGS